MTQPRASAGLRSHAAAAAHEQVERHMPVFPCLEPKTYSRSHVGYSGSVPVASTQAASLFDSILPAVLSRHQDWTSRHPECWSADWDYLGCWGCYRTWQDLLIRGRKDLSSSISASTRTTHASPAASALASEYTTASPSRRR